MSDEFVTDSDITGDAAAWTPGQQRLADIYGTCAYCGAPRTTTSWERDDGYPQLEFTCLNGHLSGLVS